MSDIEHRLALRQAKQDAAWKECAERAEAEAKHLRAAIAAELTHGGICDRIAHATAIVGAESVKGSPVRRAAEQLDRDRHAFYDRMTDALEGIDPDPPGVSP